MTVLYLILFGLFGLVFTLFAVWTKTTALASSLFYRHISHQKFNTACSLDIFLPAILTFTSIQGSHLCSYHLPRRMWFLCESKNELPCLSLPFFFFGPSWIFVILSIIFKVYRLVYWWLGGFFGKMLLSSPVWTLTNDTPASVSPVLAAIIFMPPL